MGVVWHCVSAANHWKLAAVTCGTPARGDGRRGIHSGRVNVSIRSWVLPWPKLPTIRVQSHLLQQPQQCTANETRTHEIPPSCGLVLGNGGGGGVGVAVLSLAERIAMGERGNDINSLAVAVVVVASAPAGTIAWHRPFVVDGGYGQLAK